MWPSSFSSLRPHVAIHFFISLAHCAWPSPCHSDHIQYCLSLIASGLGCGPEFRLHPRNAGGLTKTNVAQYGSLAGPREKNRNSCPNFKDAPSRSRRQMMRLRQTQRCTSSVSISRATVRRLPSRPDKLQQQRSGASIIARSSQPDTEEARSPLDAPQVRPSRQLYPGRHHACHGPCRPRKQASIHSE